MTDDEETPGQQVRRRMEKLGYTNREWYARTGIDSKTRDRAMRDDPTVKRSTWLAIFAALDKLEAYDAGEPTTVRTDPNVITFHITMAAVGVDVTMAGPVENLPEMSAEVRRLIRSGEAPDGDF